MNYLYYGDNLDVMRRHIKDETVDLVYLDPPFQSGKDYNVLFAEQNGSKSTAQIKAFDDTWRWDKEAALAFEEVAEQGGEVSQAMQAFRTFLGECDMLAYLSMMAPRLVELRRVLKLTGSIYLHCDPTASHYLKMLMDAVFHPANFRNEIAWYYRRWSAAANKYQGLHDVILFYTKSAKNIHTFNLQLMPYSDKTNKRWKGQRMHNLVTDEGKLLKTPAPDEEEKGANLGDVWEFSILNSQSKERLGYPTQKPEALLERIITVSSNIDDVVLDPFCGCGTTIAAAQRLGRSWIGIDITYLATNLIKNRLKDAFGIDALIHPMSPDECTLPKAAESSPEYGYPTKRPFCVIGEPVSVTDAKRLAESEPFQFQAWALGLVGARVATSAKKGADQGIDGRLYFHDEPEGGKTKQIIFSVKAGHTNASHIRDLRGVVEREGAAIGVLLTMQEATKPMRQEAASAGFYESPGWGKKHPRLQILTIEELLNGQTIDMPPRERRTDATFKKAQDATPAQGEQQEF